MKKKLLGLGVLMLATGSVLAACGSDKAELEEVEKEVIEEVAETENEVVEETVVESENETTVEENELVEEDGLDVNESDGEIDLDTPLTSESN